MKLKRIFLCCCICFISLFFVACRPQERTAIIEPDDDIIVTIYAYDGAGESYFGLMNLGHSFMSFENVSSEEVKIGNFSLAPNEIVTISTWCVSDHFGIWYNMENNYIKYHDKYNGRYSVSMGIKKDAQETIAKYIQVNDVWRPTKNCTNFSVGLWNKLCDSKEKLSTPLIYTPKKLVSDIKSFPTHEQNKTIAVSDRLGYFDNTNNFVTYAFDKAVEEGV